MNRIVIAALSAAVLVLAGGCSPRTAYVPETHVEYLEADTAAIYSRLRSFFESMYRNEASADTVVDRQSETVTLSAGGDTVKVTQTRYVYVSSHREKELDHKVSEKDSIIAALRQSLSSVKADSIPVPYPVERKLTRWQQTKMDLGGIAIGAIALVLCIAVLWLVRTFRK